MASAPFLTEVDPRAAVKGSVDPLLLEPVWIGLGRRVIGNLTIAASSVAGYKTTLLALHVAELVRSRQPRLPVVDAFLRVEQVVSYSRAAAGDTAFRGVERVKARLTGRGGVTISQRAEHQTLSDQRQYGLYGLYLNASRASGWVVPGEVALTHAGRAFVEAHLQPRVGAPMQRLLDLATGPEDATFHLQGRDAALATSLASLMASMMSAESEALADALVRGGNASTTDGRQRRLAVHVEAMDLEREYDMSVHREVIRRAESAGDDELVSCLRDIEAVEPLLVGARGAFDFALERGDRRIDEIAAALDAHWPGLPTLDIRRLSEMANDSKRFPGDAEGAKRLVGIASALSRRDFSEAIRRIFEHSRHVMVRRGSGPWAVIRPDDTLERRRWDETAYAPDAEEMARPWRSTYFLGALWSVAGQLLKGSVPAGSP